MARKSPLLSVETKGPRRIAIGKEATYEVTIQNSGEVVAEEVVVFVGLPESAEISAPRRVRALRERRRTAAARG